ncbi:hypothetical protein GJ496_000177 [Pomphorhynchus laevis]|nr:hypothetical protein GJ496_000177 [Pomphorhynchus laevis]
MMCYDCKHIKSSNYSYEFESFKSDSDDTNRRGNYIVRESSSIRIVDKGGDEHTDSRIDKDVSEHDPDVHDNHTIEDRDDNYVIDGIIHKHSASDGIMDKGKHVLADAEKTVGESVEDDNFTIEEYNDCDCNVCESLSSSDRFEDMGKMAIANAQEDDGKNDSCVISNHTIDNLDHFVNDIKVLAIRCKSGMRGENNRTNADCVNEIKCYSKLDREGDSREMQCKHAKWANSVIVSAKSKGATQYGLEAISASIVSDPTTTVQRSEQLSPELISEINDMLFKLPRHSDNCVEDSLNIKDPADDSVQTKCLKNREVICRKAVIGGYSIVKLCEYSKAGLLQPCKEWTILTGKSGSGFECRILSLDKHSYCKSKTFTLPFENMRQAHQRSQNFRSELTINIGGGMHHLHRSRMLIQLPVNTPINIDPNVTDDYVDVIKCFNVISITNSYSLLFPESPLLKISLLKQACCLFRITHRAQILSLPCWVTEENQNIITAECDFLDFNLKNVDNFVSPTKSKEDIGDDFHPEMAVFHRSITDNHNINDEHKDQDKVADGYFTNLNRIQRRVVLHSDAVYFKPGYRPVNFENIQA